MPDMTRQVMMAAIVAFMEERALRFIFDRPLNYYVIECTSIDSPF